MSLPEEQTETDLKALRELVNTQQQVIKDSKEGFKAIKELQGFQLPQAWQIADKWLTAHGDKVQ